MTKLNLMMDSHEPTLMRQNQGWKWKLRYGSVMLQVAHRTGPQMHEQTGHMAIETGQILRDRLSVQNKKASNETKRVTKYHLF